MKIFKFISITLKCQSLMKFNTHITIYYVQRFVATVTEHQLQLQQNKQQQQTHNNYTAAIIHSFIQSFIQSL